MFSQTRAGSHQINLFFSRESVERMLNDGQPYNSRFYEKFFHITASLASHNDKLSLRLYSFFHLSTCSFL